MLYYPVRNTVYAYRPELSDLLANFDEAGGVRLYPTVFAAKYVLELGPHSFYLHEREVVETAHRLIVTNNYGSDDCERALMRALRWLVLDHAGPWTDSAPCVRLRKRRNPRRYVLEIKPKASAFTVRILPCVNVEYLRLAVRALVSASRGCPSEAPAVPAGRSDWVANVTTTDPARIRSILNGEHGGFLVEPHVVTFRFGDVWYSTPRALFDAEADRAFSGAP